MYTRWPSGAISEGTAIALIFSAANVALYEAALDRKPVYTRGGGVIWNVSAPHDMLMLRGAIVRQEP